MAGAKINSTMCYIEKDGCYLMLYRNKKKEDPCEGKWVGVGGKFEAGESPQECLLREVREETGLTLTRYHFCGVDHFLSDTWPDEDMYLYTATGFEGGGTEDFDCDEGELRWIPKDRIEMTCRYEGHRCVEVSAENQTESECSQEDRQI